LHVKSFPSELRLRRLEIFRSKLHGCYFNCFAWDHSRANCREPTNCWCYKKSGHTSSFCPRAQPSRACKSSAQATFSSSLPSCSLSEATAMERHHSFGSASTGSQAFDRRGVGERGRSREPRGSVVNYPGNPASALILHSN
jgi:hypothetical protein